MIRITNEMLKAFKAGTAANQAEIESVTKLLRMKELEWKRKILFLELSEQIETESYRDDPGEHRNTIEELEAVLVELIAISE